MFRAVPMMHLHAVVLEQDERAVLKGLGQLGAVQLTRTRSGPDTAPLAPRDRTGELTRCDRIRTRVEELRRLLGLQPSPKGPRLPEMTLNQAEEKLRCIEEQVAGPLSHRQSLMQRQSELAATCERISCYRGLDIPLEQPDWFSFLHFVTGSLPVQNLANLEKKIAENVALFPIAQQKGRQSLVAITTHRGRPTLESALQQAGFQREVLPTAHSATVDALSEEGELEREQVAAELERLDSELQTLAAEFTRPLAEIEGLINVECRLLDAGQKFPRTETAILLTGWVPADAASTLEQRIEEVTGGRYATETSFPDDSTGDQIPVLIHHSRLLRPFEMLVSTYGLPNYRELEPTLFVALSYVLMFGMMFGDAGHGAILALCGLLALVTGRSEKVRDFGLLLFFGGSSSIIFGVVYGSYFGIGLFKKYALWHDPLEGDPIRLMFGAIGFGVAMISLGLILNVINRFRRGDVIGGFLDKFGLAGLFFYWGALVLLTNRATIESRGFMGLSIALFLVFPMVGWAVKEPMEYLLGHGAGGRDDATGGLAGAAIESLVGAFEGVLSYLANTISFVRLAAYAMSHAALLVAAFMLAAQVRDISMGGGLWSLLVIILGNLIAIVLEGIIASVQALRLEYYEFFGKFFSGNGQPFEPFRLAADGQASASVS
jgi:V/A-type H+/Na+-transporting ATPase subunit I